MSDEMSGSENGSDESVAIGVLTPVLSELNELVALGLLGNYAIGGGVAVLYYAEPVLTYDFDVVCTFPQQGALIDPSPVFEHLKKKGYVFGEEDRIDIAGIPVQFVPASTGLMEEALENAYGVEIGGVKTRVLSVEYLIATLLDLYRPKDRAKLAVLLDAANQAVDDAALTSILAKHGLTEKWARFNEA
ncbi:MAG: hypothetical protein JXR37_29600 [Kiritimatiellae bacterium]|nr:hypothetical protein [Kiritimatiellia bacterium]